MNAARLPSDQFAAYCELSPFPTVPESEEGLEAGEGWEGHVHEEPGACWVELLTPRKKTGWCRDLPGDTVTPVTHKPPC